MSATEAVLRDVAVATTLELPLGFRWFGRPGPRLPEALAGALSPEQARAYLRESLQHHLYSHVYTQGRVSAARVTRLPDPVAGEAFVDRLSAANVGTGAWQDGWELRLRLDRGGVLASRQGLLVRADADQWRPVDETDPPTTDVSLRLAKEARARQPSFYIALSDVVLDVDRERLVRVYWNVPPAGAPGLVRHVTVLLNAARVPFGLKLVNDPGAYDRCDAAVLYLPRDRWPEVAPVLTRVHAGVRASLRASVPVFTRRLAPGLGLAEDPEDRESFGLSRCAVVAEGLVRAAEAGRTTVQDRVVSVLGCFAEEGIDPDRAHLEPAPGGDYPWRGAAGPDREPRAVHGAGVDIPGHARPTTAELGEVADGIAEALVREAVWFEGRCTWVGADPAALERSGESVRRWTTLDGSLYSGTAGVTAFLTRMAVHRLPSVRETALGAARHALRRAAGVSPDHRLGLFTGGLGGALAAAQAGRLLGDGDLVGAAADVALRCVSAREPRRQRDLIDGDAGAVVALLGLADLLDAPSFGALAEDVAGELVEAGHQEGDGLCWPSLTGPALTGLSHGAAGAVWALRELDARRPDARWRRAAQAAARFEASWFDVGVGNWRDRRELPGTDDFMTAWCHGAPGVVLGRTVRPGEDVGDEQAQLAAGLQTTREMIHHALDAECADFSLCHGLGGLADVLLEVGRASGHEADQRLAAEVGRHGVEAYVRPGQPWPCGTPSGESPSLMLGRSGIGWFFLRLAEPDVPSPLLPRPGDWRSAGADPQTWSGPARVTVRRPAPASGRVALSGADVGAVVRLGLAAGGFRSRTADLRARASRWGAGVALRDRYLLAQLPDWADVLDHLRLPEEEPRLWDSLPLMLAFGTEQADALLATVQGEDPLGSAGRTCALFSTLLSSFDHVVDETAHADALYAVEPLGVAVLAGTAPADALRGPYQEHPAAAVRFVCALFAALGTSLDATAAAGARPAATSALRRALVRLFAAERTSTLGRARTPAELERLGRASREKSVLPFVVLAQLVSLVATGSAPPARMARASAAIGRAICLADDLMDLLTDLERGAPSPFVVALGGPATTRAAVDVAALLGVVAQGTADLLTALDAPALAAPDGRSEAQHFARSAVARWVGWHEPLDDPAVVPAAAQVLPLVTDVLRSGVVDPRVQSALDVALDLLGEGALAAAIRRRPWSPGEASC